MTERDFRRLALSFAGAAEQAHMGHPDFRANGRIFATLAHERRLAMVKLEPEAQQTLLREHPHTFFPAAGTWGLQGATMVRLEAADEETVGAALTEAWRKVNGGDRKPDAPRPRRSRNPRSSRGM